MSSPYSDDQKLDLHFLLTISPGVEESVARDAANKLEAEGYGSVGMLRQSLRWCGVEELKEVLLHRAHIPGGLVQALLLSSTTAICTR